MSLTTHLLFNITNALNIYTVNITFAELLQTFPSSSCVLLMHNVAFYCVPAATITDAPSFLSCSLWLIFEEGRPGFVCLVCRLHFPEGLWTLIRPVWLSSQLWIDLTCPGSLVIAFKWQTTGPGQFWSTLWVSRRAMFTRICVCAHTLSPQKAHFTSHFVPTCEHAALIWSKHLSPENLCLNTVALYSLTAGIQ